MFLTACATEPMQLPSAEIAQEVPVTQEAKETQSQSNSTGATFFSAPSDSGASTQPSALPDSSTSQSPKKFALDLIELMGTSPGKCGVAAQNTPQVNWTCAEYTNGLGAFIAKWDKLITSTEVSLNHAHIATSDWMYFAIEGEIDFFWKTYDLDTTQILVAYDPSEKGNELIIGFNSSIGDQIAAANGSHSFSNPSQSLPDLE